MPPHEPAVDRPLTIEEIFKAHAEFVWRVLRRQGVPEEDVEDAVQEVFLAVHGRLDEYEERGAIRAWLFTISRQVGNHYRRSAARRDRKQRAVMMAPVVSPKDPHTLAQHNEAVSLVHDFLATLGADQAMVFYLSEVEGMSAPEVSAALSVNLNTIYARLRLARKRFEQMLSLRRAEEEER
jgi:RNA polymerase sigma-70 factor (ECF subfamily)